MSATAAELLEMSIAAHGHFRESKAKKLALSARESMVQAEDLRKRAHDLDPQHTDLAWGQFEPTHPHDALLTFYAEQLAR